MEFFWKRFAKNGYECSSVGDARFSAFNAILPDGRSIEMHYRCDVKGYDPGGTDWRLGKGKPSLVKMHRQELFAAYYGLWQTWAFENPMLMQTLREKACEYSNTLTDRFASTEINQAHALSLLLTAGHGRVEKEQD